MVERVDMVGVGGGWRDDLERPYPKSIAECE